MSKRFFLGFKIPRSIIETINMVRTTLGDDHQYFKWVSGNNLHLTLLFLGHQETDQIPNLLKIINTSLENYNDFSFSINGTGTISDDRILWLGVEKGKDELVSINYELRMQLKEYIDNIDNNKFNPHITVGRKKKDYIHNKIDVKNFMNSVYFPIEFHVKFFTLFESKIINNKVHYERIKEFNIT